MKKIEMQTVIDDVMKLDGSLRDIYIFDVVLEDWNRMLKLLKGTYALTSDEEITPDSIIEIIPICSERGFLLRVMLGEGIFAHCHFYVSEDHPSPIEFDLDPREIQKPESFKKMLEFMRFLGDGLNKDVFLTEESTEDNTLLYYSCATQEHFYRLPEKNLN